MPFSKPSPVLVRLSSTLLSAFFLFSLANHSHAAEDIVIADFEGPDYGRWKATGDAFGFGPARGALPNQMQVDGFSGSGFVNSYHKGDDATGTLTSAPFRLERRYLRFLIGGGGFEGKTCMNLLLDGKVVRTATGPNKQPGGSEHLDWAQWEVGEFSGQSAVIEIVDNAKGSWGHVNVDQIVQTDQPLPAWISNVTRELNVTTRYLNLPVKNGAPKRLLTLRSKADGKLLRQFDIELADQAPDWWAVVDVQAFRDQSILIQVDKLREDSSALQQIEASNEIRSGQALYQEALRPQFHFTSQRGWNNDPNGLVFYKGEYHLFYQHNPYGWNWGNMHWGHAVSPDLVHWRELGDALYPDALGTMFSGSAVVDWPNSAGFARENDEAIVCFYTAAGGTSPQSQGARFTQCLAYSVDRGRTWTKYAQNPVVPHVQAENRDPKVLWYAPEKKWVMALYLDGNDFALFSSTNLKSWERLSTVKVPGTSECPEFFEIAVDQNPQQHRWVFYGGNGRYLIGRFDGKTFTPESGPHDLNYGNCFYASQTYSDLPASDGRRILVPWGQVSLPGMPFNQMIGLPVELTLRTTEQGLRLHAVPVKELASLRKRSQSFDAQPLVPGQNPLSSFRAPLLDLEATVALGDAQEVGFNLHGIAIHYDVAKQELACAQKKALLKPDGGKIQLRLLVDRASIDIFGNDGRLYMPMGMVVPQENPNLEIYARGGTAQIRSLTLHELGSAWSE